LNFDIDYLFAYDDPTKTIYNDYSIKNIIFVQEEHINQSSDCKEDTKDIDPITIHTAIIKNPKTNNIDIVSLNELDFKVYSNNKMWNNVYRVWNKNNIITNASSRDIEMSKKIDIFLEYGDSLWN